MKKWIKRISLTLLLVLLLITTLFFINFMQFSSQQVDVDVEEVAMNERSIDILSQSVRFKTISYEDRSKIDIGEFEKFHAFIEKSFPKVHKHLQREKVNHSLLYTWKGSDPSLDPYLLMGHMDVVPIEKGTEKNWEYPPFSGKVTQEHIWGRGTMDDKGMIVSILEATEMLLEQNFTPKRTVYFCFGHDEEIDGLHGAKKVAELLKSRGIRLSFVLDEGLVVTRGLVPGLSGPVAVIGIAEKGFVNLELKVVTKGGHSSMPSYPSTIGILSTAIHKLEKNLLPAKISGAARKMFEFLGPEMSFAEKMAMANLWILEPLIISQLEKKATSNSLLRTTTAVTVIKAGEKNNVLSSHARAVVNFRIIPGETVSFVKKRVEEIIGDARVKVNILGEGAGDPSKVSPVETFGFRTLQRSISQVFADVLVAPGLMVARTDSRHFEIVCDNVYRFAPMLMFAEDVGRIHGTNERLTIKNFKQCIQFFYHLIKNAQSQS
ncbi:M20 family peptidase [Candidatus Uabimicrobium amorphum]|uniref:Peptidase M20 n=1 Tax=Uabimicrobium amorphum TaxID=2596890 RepID=A0A5S9IUV2_UABAM|nr:M20 family peptidase [Candidatus Uabimicrobium amorphum]BBM87560.1 peptidase M20 [Candidatus Uabimicrobium amorphum]